MAQNLKATVVLEDANGGTYNQKREGRVISSDSELSKLNADLQNGSVAAVDFNKQTLIVLFSGGHPTGGYGIELKSVEKSGDKITVTAVFTEPGKGCMTPQMMTSPVLVAKVDAAFTSADFNLKTVTKDCE